MRKILILGAVLFLLSGCAVDNWEARFGKDFRYHVSLRYFLDTDLLVQEYKFVKSAEKTHLVMRDGLLFTGNGEIRGVQFSRLSVYITPEITVSIRELKNVSKK